MRPHPTHPAGVVMPRYQLIGGDEIVQADRIDKAGFGYLHLACGARVVLDEKVLENGPSNTGDYVILGKDDGSDRLVRGYEFLAKYRSIPHGLDIPEVSAALDPQAGSVNQPVNAGDPERPVNANQVPAPASNTEAVTADVERHANEPPKAD